MNLVSSDALQIARIEVVVFDGIAGARDVGLLEAADGTHQRQLHVERQAGGDAVGIDLVRVQPFRLEEDLVAVLVGEAHHLVLDGRAVARPDAFDDAGVHRRAVQAGADDFVGALVGVGDVARHLARVLVGAAQIRKHRHRIVAGLRLADADNRCCGRRCAAACRSSAAPPETAVRAAARASALAGGSPARPPA